MKNRKYLEYCTILSQSYVGVLRVKILMLLPITDLLNTPKEIYITLLMQFLPVIMSSLKIIYPGGTIVS